MKLTIHAFIEGIGAIAFDGEAEGDTLAEAVRNYKHGEWYGIDNGSKYTLVPAHMLRRLEFKAAEVAPEAVAEEPRRRRRG